MKAVGLYTARLWPVVSELVESRPRPVLEFIDRYYICCKAVAFGSGNRGE